LIARAGIYAQSWYEQVAAGATAQRETMDAALTVS
jgi:hypothetical protein